MDGGSRQPGGAGSLWQDADVIALTPSGPVSAGGRGGRARALSVVYVATEDAPEPLPLQCLREACGAVPRGARLSSLPFGTVALVGDTDALDAFYNAGEPPSCPARPPRACRRRLRGSGPFPPALPRAGSAFRAGEGWSRPRARLFRCQVRQQPSGTGRRGGCRARVLVPPWG